MSTSGDSGPRQEYDKGPRQEREQSQRLTNQVCPKAAGGVPLADKPLGPVKLKRPIRVALVSGDEPAYVDYCVAVNLGVVQLDAAG